MQLQDDIILTVLQAKNLAGCWASTLINNEKNGEDITCCEKKLMFLVKLVKVMESYYCENYNGDGKITDPSYTCLTQDQAKKLLSNIKSLIN